MHSPPPLQVHSARMWLVLQFVPAAAYPYEQAPVLALQLVSGSQTLPPVQLQVVQEVAPVEAA